MGKQKVIDKTALIIAIASFIFSLWLFTGDTNMPVFSLIASLLASLLIFVSYVILRWFILALRR